VPGRDARQVDGKPTGIRYRIAVEVDHVRGHQMATRRYSGNVFVNCPFDHHYEPLFYGTIFTVFDCGFVPRCAMEVDDGAQVRIDKIMKIIGECRYGIHDLCRTAPDSQSGLPRFNMPFELGLFMGAKKYGDKLQQTKSALIMDTEAYRYQSFISDIAGQDIKAHEDDVPTAIGLIRNWLRQSSRRTTIPGGRAIAKRYQEFQEALPSIRSELRLDADEVSYADYTHIVETWLRQNG